MGALCFLRPIMEPLFLVLLLAAGVHLANRFEQRERIALLARYLGRFPIERDMGTLVEGYLPALTEPDSERRTQRLQALAVTEQRLVEKLGEFNTLFEKVWGEQRRVSRWLVAVPRATRMFPRASFDLREAFLIHTEGIARAAANADGLAPRERAFRLTAELLLLQHSCHWFCRSRAVANARMLAHHQSSYAQVLAGVDEKTRRAYTALVAG